MCSSDLLRGPRPCGPGPAQHHGVRVAFWAPLIPWVVVSTRTPLAWAALVVSQVLFLSLWSLSVSLMRVWSWARSPVGQALGCALAWTGVEQARSAFPWSGFSWGTVALPQVDSPLGRLAPYGGVALVSFAVMAVGAEIGRASCRERV